MPFTHGQFLDLFGTYNSQLAPVVAGLWIVSLVAVARYFRGELTRASAAGLLAAHWAWSGAVFHAAYFTRINHAAWLFAALFLAEAGAFLWLARRRDTAFVTPERDARTIFAAVFLIAALVYPALILMTGHAVPRAPLFAVPCPTTLLTAGLLLALGPLAPRWLFVIPVSWAAIGGFAALALGVLPDYLLLAAGAVLVVFMLLPTLKRQVLAQAGR